MTDHSTAVRSTARGSTKQPVRAKSRGGHRHDSAASQPPHNVTPDDAAQTLDHAQLRRTRSDLLRRQAELQAEHQTAMAELRATQRDRQADTSGDDQGDVGNKTHQREQELTLAHGILERIEQVERAVSRIDAETYGQCERCGNQIPIARLEAFPSATLCVACKQRAERH